MALTDADRQEYLALNVSADLTYIWESLGVSLERQYTLGQHYVDVRRFAALADTRAEARAALRADLRLDPDQGPEERAQLAALVASWSTCFDGAERERQLTAEAHVLGLPKPLPPSERGAMRKAVEKVVGRLEEREEPAATYVAMKLEETESGEIVGSPLSDVASASEEASASLQSSLDPSGRIRITKERSKSKLPTSSEELRHKIKLEMNTFLMLAAKFRSKVWFENLCANDFNKHVDFVLGEKVYRIQMASADGTTTQAMQPSWTLVLAFEQKLRHEAYKRACRDGKKIVDTLEEVRSDASLKETHFITPLALEVASRSTNTTKEERPNKYARFELNSKAKKGRGKGKKGSSSGFQSKKGFVHSQTPDGRQICYGYNNNKCTTKGCQRVHCCQFCLQSHPKSACPGQAQQTDSKQG